jgi:hypothetical protein
LGIRTVLSLWWENTTAFFSISWREFRKGIQISSPRLMTSKRTMACHERFGEQPILPCPGSDARHMEIFV